MIPKSTQSNIYKTRLENLEDKMAAITSIICIKKCLNQFHACDECINFSKLLVGE